MPRTKATRKKVAPNPVTNQAIEFLETTRKAVHLKYDQKANDYLAKVKTDLNKLKLSIPVHLTPKTLGELVELPLNWSGNTTSASVMHILDASKAVTEKKRPLTRSSSFADDEGYLTAGSTNGTLGSRQSRARNKQPKSSRTSRSLSTRTKKTNPSVERFKTPAQKIPANSYGLVTPKMKPNTPQVLMRRPMPGEVAISLQGSPLCTGPVATDNVANINIPLENGKILAIQPQKGLRMSQIPTLDLETKQQLLALRENLDKMCGIAAKR